VAPHPSSSHAQRDAERHILDAVARRVGVPLAPARVELGDGVRVELDGADDDRTVLVEVFAHLGAVKPGQARKMATDAFKLIWAGRRLDATRLVIAVADPATEAYLRRPSAWLTAALRDSGVEVLRVEVDAAVLAEVAAAQRNQYR
jgi:hypothetical protein